MTRSDKESKRSDSTRADMEERRWVMNRKGLAKHSEDAKRKGEAATR